MSDTWSSVEENPERVFRDTHPEGNSASDILYLLEQNWSRFVSSFILTERLKNRARRVDGLIIGTGESDFTKGNTHYDLCIDDKVFRLIDVPGIEGNENCYADLVKEAVAQAHWWFMSTVLIKNPKQQQPGRSNLIWNMVLRFIR
ncbi:hypothetical protein O5838_09495 [Escherichia coli]|nr:hypothetical protein [Escherichia coli]